MVGIYEYQCVNWDLGACWNTERGQGSTSVVVVGRNVHDTCMQNARQQHILMHRRGWARQSRMRFGRMFRELKGLKKNERKSRKQKSKHNDKPRTAKNHICTRLIAQMQHINWIKKKANEKKKQCKINAKRRGRIYYTQNHPQDTGRIAKNAQERESNTTNNHKQQKEQKNNHTVFNPEFAEKHKKKIQQKHRAQFNFTWSGKHAQSFARASKKAQSAKGVRSRRFVTMPTRQAKTLQKIRHQRGSS